MTSTFALFLGFLVVLPVHAQPTGDQSPDRATALRMPTQPGNAATDLPVVVYRSALTGYRSFRDEKVSSWQESNDNVARIGGWRAYTREAREPEPAQRDVPAAAGQPHPGHGK